MTATYGKLWPAVQRAFMGIPMPVWASLWGLD